ncbi:hypothetical protein [Caenimonas aquaedulcis]|uniref:Uncharacterized protein n=1 Tax=Caenimonas aquaedulcis TaxID=2793270 RepID=A0A931H8J4_9BURK|nr:hypothetical protein [Caenimonas aquaedulcis]MBG9390367.1 hypothetical protein [Caenimonas aquaedulcis]
MPAPEVVEASSDSAWALFNELAQAPVEPAFQPTAPASAATPLVKGDRRYAPTVPSPLTASAPARPQPTHAIKGITVAEAMVEARRNNRLCPQPLLWKQLYDMLPDKVQGDHGWQPQPPLIGSAWSSTPPLVKRMCLRDHIEWAEGHGVLDEVHAFLKALPETDWHHMGD